MAGKFLSQNEIADRVKAARKAKRLSQDELADQLGLPEKAGQAEVSKWERGERPIPRNYLEGIAALTERPLGYFVLSDSALKQRTDELIIAEWLEARAQELRDGTTSASSRAGKRAEATKGQKGRGGRRGRTGTGGSSGE